MFDPASVSISVVSLALSIYAIFRVRPKSPTPPTGRAGGRNRDSRPALATMEERRETIAARTFDPEIIAAVIEGRKKLDRGSRLIPPDPESQNPGNFRSRHR